MGCGFNITWTKCSICEVYYPTPSLTKEKICVMCYKAGDK